MLMYPFDEVKPELAFKARILSVDLDADGHLHIEIDAGRINSTLGKLLKICYEGKKREIIISKYYRKLETKSSS